MKKCKENYIKILAAMRDNAYDVARGFEKDGNAEIAQKERDPKVSLKSCDYLSCFSEILR